MWSLSSFFQVKVHKFLEKTKKKTQKRTKNKVEEAQTVTKEQEVIHKHLKDLMKKQKGQIVRKIVKERDDSKPWVMLCRLRCGFQLQDMMACDLCISFLFQYL